MPATDRGKAGTLRDTLRDLAGMRWAILCLYVLLLSLWVIVLYDEYYSRSQMRQLWSEIEEAWHQKVHACQLYERQVHQARELLRSGKRGDAVAKLEEAIGVARTRGLIPLRGTPAPTGGEILLMRLYEEDAGRDREFPGRKGFCRYMESAYPQFWARYSEYERLWRQFVERVSRDAPR